MVIEFFDYFNNNLPCPPYSDKQWSIDAISWLKDSATIYKSKLHDLISILVQYDINTSILNPEKSGMVLYEDEFQIVSQDRIH